MSLEKNIDLSMLLDFYGDMLTDKQRETVEMYVNDDLSLSEIADITGLTRPGVRDRIVKSEAALREYESKLGLLHRFLTVRGEIERITDRLEEIAANSGVDLRDVINELRRIESQEG
ncbi:MAG: DNA-binding protein [Clostridia bacterium]|nr:DNA-binding protein [Clostridia bacterium]